MLSSITFSGADHTVARHRLHALCQTRRFPIEIALLVSEPRMGSTRYPSMAVASGLVEIVKGAGQRVAAHLCGGAARVLFSGGWRPGFLPGLVGLLKNVDRIQINVPEELVTQENMLKAQRLIQDQLGPKDLIFQWREPQFPVPPPGIQWLFDVSAGNGRSPSSWPAPPEDQIVGLAGGLGPRLIAPLLTQIGYTEAKFWIDMESSLRDREDRFSVDTCFQILEEAHEASHDCWVTDNSCGACGNLPPCPCTVEADQALDDEEPQLPPA